ncbi:hypothetical protein, partial [Sulfurovum sp.]|uniref:hypothetical protein n=1 Tax=Sulfurovum sp. TaxID=1969726 RepID=UPI003563812C
TPATYFSYITSVAYGEKYGVSKWNQSFSSQHNYQDLIEAGTILEDALWAGVNGEVLGWLADLEWDWDLGNGRFVNHFYEWQDNGAKLSWISLIHRNTDAVSWAYDGGGLTNDYSYTKALEYFKIAFFDKNTTSEQRTENEAKMFISLGHVLHMLNDMNVPAHVRDDMHATGDPFEVWMRGGERGRDIGGFKVAENRIAEPTSVIVDAVSQTTPTKYQNFNTFMQKEAEFTSENFFSKDTLTSVLSAYVPKKDELPKYFPAGENAGYVLSNSPDVDANHNKLARVNRSYIYVTHRGVGEYKPVYSYVLSEENLPVLIDNGVNLISHAVANAEGFINYFFRGRLEAEVMSCGFRIKNISDPTLVATPSTVTFNRGGTFLIYAFKPDGSRTYIMDYPLIRDLPVNGEIIVPDFVQRLIEKGFVEDNASLPITVVFKGSIGGQDGLAVVKTTVAAPTLSQTLTRGVIEVTLSWDRCYPMVDLDLETDWDAGVLEVHDDENSTFEYYVIKDEMSIYPGSYSFYGRDKTDHSLLDEEAMQEDPIDIYIFAKAPGTKKLYKVEAFIPEQLDIGRLFDIDIREKEVVVYPAPNVTPVVTAPYRPVERSFETNDCSGNKSCGCIPCEYKIRGPLQEVTLGPISGAAVTVYKASDMNTPLFVGKTTEGNDIYTTGIIEIPPEEAAIFDDDEIYIIKAQGGVDIDSNDDFFVDEFPVTNNGTLHAIATGKQLKDLSLKVNILAEIAYQVSKDKLGDPSKKAELFAHLDDVAKRILSNKVFPIDGDYSIYYSDILLWLPTVDKKLLFKDYDTYVHPIVEKVYADSDYVQDAYKFVYESVTPGAPEIFGFAGQVDVDAPANSIIGALEIASEGSSAITTITLSGEGHENFTVDTKGVFRVAQG